MPRIWKHGDPITDVCARCGGRMSGRIHLSGPRWEIHFECGHKKVAGWTRPPEELTRQGLVNNYVHPDREKILRRNQEKIVNALERYNFERDKRERENSKSHY